MSDLNRDARAILDAARHLDDPRPSDRARVRRALLARVAAGGAATLLTSSAAAAPALLKVLLPLTLVVAGGVGGTLWWRAHQTPDVAAGARVERSSARAPTVLEPVAGQTAGNTAEPAPDVEPAPARVNVPTRPRARTATTTTTTTTRNLDVETSMLADANHALRDGEARRSLKLLDEYDRRFPAGELRQEMTATRIIARCQLAPGGGAQEAARAFLAQYPASPLASRVRSSCAKADR